MIVSLSLLADEIAQYSWVASGSDGDSYAQPRLQLYSTTQRYLSF
jgi:hypothetical protein